MRHRALFHPKCVHEQFAEVDGYIFLTDKLMPRFLKTYFLKLAY